MSWQHLELFLGCGTGESADALSPVIETEDTIVTPDARIAAPSQTLLPLNKEGSRPQYPW